MASAAAPFDWSRIRLVAFDVDGTLYRQRPIRLRVTRMLLLDALRRRDLKLLRALSVYRRVREQLAEEGVEDCDRETLARTAAAVGRPAAEIAALVSDWMHVRPLPHLLAGRYAGIDALFAAVRRSGRIVGVLSDYPAVAKIEALGLRADHVVSAGDDGVGVLKPNPRGLRHLMKLAQVSPEQTVLIGDRVERDGHAARAAGVEPLLLSRRPLPGWRSFQSYSDPLFRPLLDAA